MKVWDSWVNKNYFIFMLDTVLGSMNCIIYVHTSENSILKNKKIVEMEGWRQCFDTNYAIKLRHLCVICCHSICRIMSHDNDLLISVPRACITEFYSKYLNLVETFYYVTLSEDKSSFTKEKGEYAYFNVIFNLNPTDENYNPRELVGRIQVSESKIYSSVCLSV